MATRPAHAALRPTPATEQTRKWEDPNPTKSMGSWGAAPGSPAGLLSMMFRMTESERIERPFSQSPIVNACVQVRAELFCAARPRLWRSNEDDADELEPGDPLAQLFARPNALMGRVKFWRSVSQHFSLSGGTFLFLTKPGSDEPIGPNQIPGAMWPIREDLVDIKLDARNRPGFYEFSVGQKRVQFPAHAVAHIYDADPDNPYRGIGALQAAFRTVNNLYLAQGFDDALVRSGGQIGGFISPKDGMALDPEAQKALLDSLQQKNLDPRKNGKWAITPEGLDFKAASWSPKDMEAKDLRILGRNEVMMVFRLTPPLLGIVEDVNRANGAVARRVFYESHGIPFYEFIADEVQTQLLPLVGRPEVAFSFDWQSIPAMREDAAALIERAEKLMDMGRSFREACTLVGWDCDLEEMDGVDERFRKYNWIPFESESVLEQQDGPAVSDSAPEDDGQTSEEEPAKTVEPKSLARDATSARQRRIDAIAANEKRLAPVDRAMTRGLADVFKRFVRAQLERVREVAAQADGVAASVTPWETPLRSLGPSERVWAERMDLVPEQSWVTVRGISSDELEALLLRADEAWRTQLWNAAKKPLVRAIEDAARAAAQEVEAVVQIDAANPAMLRFLGQKELLLKEGPMSVVAQQVRRALLLGMADSSSTGTLADRVREVFEALESELEALADRLGTRAAMVARTETSSAANAARFEQWNASGISQHEWLSAGDELVRDSHQIDGEVVVLGERFSNGMRYPGEPGQPAGMVVNCRCALAPVIQEAVDAA